MKECRIFLIVLMLGWHFAHAQTAFFKVFSGGVDGTFSTVRQTSDGGYIVGTASGSGSFLVRTDGFANVLWAKRINHGLIHGQSIYETPDGGLMVAGEDNGEVLLFKTNSTGTVLWSKSYSGVDSFGSLSETSDEGTIITASSMTYGAGGTDMYLIRTNSVGDTLWTRTYGGTADETGYSALETADGGFIIGGETGSFGAGNKDFYLVKTDSNGDTLWTKTYGGTNAELFYSVRQTSDGGYILVGFSLSFTGMYLVKVASDGTLKWSKVYNSGVGYSVEQTQDGGYIICGEGASMILTKTDSQGDLQWEKAYGEGLIQPKGYSVQQTSDGGFVATGFSNGFLITGDGTWLVKTDSLGNNGCYEYETNPIQKSHTTLLGSGTIVGNPPTVVNISSITSSDTVMADTMCDTTLIVIQNPVFDNQINIYPNPTTGLITITGLPDETAHIEVYNVLGELVYSLKNLPFKHANASSETSIDLSGYPNGLYLVQIKSGQVTIGKKVLKQ